MSEKKISILYLILIVASLMPGCVPSEPSFECTDTIGCIHIAPLEPLRIGVLQAMSGKVANLGLEQIRGFELAIGKRKGQLMGHPITFEKEDSRCTPEGGAIAALRLMSNPQIIGVLGTTCSGAATSASKIISQAGGIMISGNNSAPSLTSLTGEKGSDRHPGYFRTSFNDGIAGKVAAMFVFQKLGVKKAATIHDGDVYTRGLAQGFRHTFESLGGEIVLYTAINKGDKDMKPVLTSVAASGAELLFFPLFQAEGEHIVQQVRDIPGLERLILMGSGALLTSTFIDTIRKDGIGIYFVGPAPSEGEAYKQLHLEYESRYGKKQLTTYYTYGYDAASLLLYAIETVAIKERDNTLHIGREALRKALHDVRDFKGVTGRLSCDQFGDCGSPKFNIMRLDNPDTGLEGLKSNIIYSYN